MTTTLPVSSASAAAAAPAREPAIDLARAWCLASVVVLHAIMVGVSAPGGVPLLENAMETWPGFPALTWVLQVMPLFFVLGGFSSFTQWSRLRLQGVTPGSYVAMRVRRLLPPAIGAVAAIAAFLVALTIAGVSPDIVATAGFRMSMPLWFLGVYLGCSALVPALTAAYRRTPLGTAGALAAAVLAVDAARALTGIEGLGFLNLAFVWLLLQVVGFAVADGRFDRMPRPALAAAGAGALGILAALAAAGVYPWDLLDALNPPCFALVLLGIAQLAGLLLLRPSLGRLAARPVAATIAGWINARAMTIYAWHMLVLIGFAGLLLVTGIPLPAPTSAEWWATRPLWLAAVALGVFLVASLAGRLETTRGAAVTATPRPIAAVLVGIPAVVGILVFGASPLSWVAGAALLVVALRLAGQSLSAGTRRSRVGSGAGSWSARMSDAAS